MVCGISQIQSPLPRAAALTPLTTCTRLLVLPWKLLFPAYSALTVVAPCGSELVASVATPLPFRATAAPRATPLVLNCMFPAGVGPPGTVLVTVAVNVTCTPGTEGFGEEARVLVVVAMVIVPFCAATKE